MNQVPVLAPRPDERVVEATLRDQLALFHLDTRRLHLLNRSAAAIWSQLHDAATVGQVTAALAESFGVDPRSIRADVVRTIDQLRADGLLRCGDGPPPPDVVPSTASPVGLAAPVAAPASGSYAALDARIGIVCDDPEIVSAVARVLRPLRSEDPPDTAIEVAPAGESSWTISVDRASAVSVGSRLSAALRVIGEVNGIAVASVPDDLVFHAGAVGDGTRAVLLPAAANHGKSTLTTALVAAGLEYLTDEAAAVTADLAVRPFAKSIALDPGSFPLFDTLAPRDSDDGLAKAMAGREWHVDPARVGAVGDIAPVVAVVCPHWRAGASTRLSRLEPTEALHLLLGETFDFVRGGRPLFDRLVRLVDTVPVFRLGFGELDEAVEAVRGILADPVGG